jgi:hypothetical protein
MRGTQRCCAVGIVLAELPRCGILDSCPDGRPQIIRQFCDGAVWKQCAHFYEEWLSVWFNHDIQTLGENYRKAPLCGMTNLDENLLLGQYCLRFSLRKLV